MRESVIRSIKKEAIDKWPEEMVGYVKFGKFHPLTNISPDPYSRYKISIKDTLFLLGNNVTGLAHSHPNMDNNPSQSDINAQQCTGLTFYIVGTDGINTTEIREVR